MSYMESDNVISMNWALPATDTTGKKRLTEGEYFDFTVSSNVKGNTNVNWEIAAEDVTGSTAKKIDGKYIKLYLTKINSDGTEEEVMAPKTYKTKSANNYTGRPSGMMSLALGTTNEAFNNKYRLRMYVDESYNPQGDGGDLSFSVKVNVYGKVTTDAMPAGGTLKAYMMPEDSTMPETDFHTNEYREKITSIVTKNDNTVPTTAIASYDVSEEQNKSVMAYVEDDGTGAGTYKLTIGGIIASESMRNYFYGFKNIKALDLSNIDTSFTTDMGGMLNNCTNLKDVNLSNFDFSNITSMSANLFSSDMVDNLKVNMSNSDFHNLTANDTIIPLVIFVQELDLSNSNFSNADLTRAFAHNEIKLNFSSADLSNTNMTEMFSYNRNLASVNFEKVKTASVTNMSQMFVGCSGITSLDLSDFDTSSVTAMNSMLSMCSNLETINLKGLDTRNVTTMNGMFAVCSKLSSLELDGFNTSKVVDMSGMFNSCSNLKSINLNGFDFSNVTSKLAVFSYNPSTELKISMVGCNFKNLSESIISSIISGSGKEINLKNADFTNANLTNVFAGSSYSLVDLNGANFTNATMANMFAGNSKLTNVNLKNIKTTEVTNMSSMFYGTSKLTSITVSNKWVIGADTNITDMFSGCGTDHVTTI